MPLYEQGLCMVRRKPAGRRALMPAAWSAALISLTQSSSSSSSWLTKLRYKVMLGLVACLPVPHEAWKIAMYHQESSTSVLCKYMHRASIGLMHVADE